jgi:trehalose 6-phosphate synthase
MSRIIILSNRVSVPAPDRAVHPGGLEVALRGVVSSNQCVWMGWSGEAVAEPDEVQVRHAVADGTEYIVTDLSRRDVEEYYSGFANRVLWPVLHYRQDLAEFSRRDLSGYLRVNEIFVELLIRHLRPDDIIWVHDYHLMPLARLLRARGFANRIGFFLHIPMPPPEVVAAMPHHERVLGALAEYDLVGFQTETDTANFARYVARQFGGSPHLGAVPGGMRIGTFPVGINSSQFASMAQAAQADPIVRKLKEDGPRLVLGVDRLDYSKGLAAKFDAFERLLLRHPMWHGKATLLQIAPKSRTEIAEYAAMEKGLDTLSGQINAHYGDVLWTPVRLVTRAYDRMLLAGFYRIAAVGLVTPLRDGMNLVAKEYVAAQDPGDPGVLVLSEFAGAAAELRAALLVNPNDPDAVAQAIHRALTMGLRERRERHDELAAVLEAANRLSWDQRFMARLAGTPSRSRLAAE